MTSRFSKLIYHQNAQIAFLTIIGGILRFWDLGKHSLWYDEVLNVWDSSHPFLEIHKVIHASPPLFHYLIRCFYLIFGKDDFWLRVPSAFFGTAFIPIFFICARYFSEKKTALWTTLLLVFSPFHIAYSHELRMYSLVPLLSLGSIYFLSRGLDENKVKHWFYFGVSSLLGLYTHAWFLFFLAAEAIISLTIIKPLSRRAIITFLVLALLYMPWIPYLLFQAKQDQFGFLNTTWTHHAQVTLEAFTGTRVPSGHFWVEVVVKAKPIIWAIYLFWLVASFLKPISIRGRILVYCFILTLVQPVLISCINKPIFNGGRYTIIVFPMLLCILGPSFSQTSRIGRLSKSLAIVCIFFWIQALIPFLTTFEKAPWKNLVQWLQKNVPANSGVTMIGLPETDRLIMWYYMSDSLISSNDLRNDLPLMFMPIRSYQFDELKKLIKTPWKIISIQNFHQVSVLIVSRLNQVKEE